MTAISSTQIQSPGQKKRPIPFSAFTTEQICPTMKVVSLLGCVRWENLETNIRQSKQPFGAQTSNAASWSKLRSPFSTSKRQKAQFRGITRIQHIISGLPTFRLDLYRSGSQLNHVVNFIRGSKMSKRREHYTNIIMGLPFSFGKGKLQKGVTRATKQRRNKVFDAISLLLSLRPYLTTSSWINDVFCFHLGIYMLLK